MSRFSSKIVGVWDKEDGTGVAAHISACSSGWPIGMAYFPPLCEAIKQPSHHIFQQNAATQCINVQVYLHLSLFEKVFFV